MRLKNSMRNALVSVFFQVLSLVLAFVNRIIITKLCGAEYLGLNGVFSNIVSLLSIAEGGINFAIIYAMYSAMANAEDEKLLALIQFFKKIYTIIGLVMIAIGLALIPFLTFIIGETEIKHVILIYILFLANSILPYFVADKKSVVLVAQKEYKITIAINIIKMIQLLIQIVILLITKEYFAYVLVMLVATLFSNIITLLISYKVYPKQKTKEKYYLRPEDKKPIFGNVRALLISNISGVVFGATDSLIITHWLGLAVAGIYSNYYMIYTSLYVILASGINAITASVGNLNSTSNKETVYDKFKEVFFIDFFVIALFTSEMLISYQDVMLLAYGEELLLDDITMLFMSLNFLLVAFRFPTLVFRNALGIFKYDRYKGIFEVIINIGLSIILVNYLGVLGVLLGTFVSTILVSIWIEPLMLFKHGFQIKIRNFIIFILPYLSFIAVVCTGSFLFNYVNIQSSILSVFIKWIAIGITCLTYFFIFRNKAESNIVKKMLQLFKITKNNINSSE